MVFYVIELYNWNLQNLYNFAKGFFACVLKCLSSESILDRKNKGLSLFKFNIYTGRFIKHLFVNLLSMLP